MFCGYYEVKDVDWKQTYHTVSMNMHNEQDSENKYGRWRYILEEKIDIKYIQ